jgi:hypothetical protein
MKLKNNNSQEEMIGFVLIIVLVTIIALVFLAINLRKPATSLPSKELESFLQTSMRYSTDCYSSPEIRLDVKDLIIACSDNERCLAGNSSCDLLKITFQGMISQAWKPGSLTSYYSLKIYDDLNRTILNLRDGNCTGTRTLSDVSIPGQSLIRTELVIC